MALFTADQLSLAATLRSLPQRRGFHTLLLAGIALLALALRLYRLGAEPVWWDESYSWSLAKMDLASMVAATFEDVHPPLYYALLHLWVRVAGESEYALRFPSLMASVATVALVLHFARRISGIHLALVSGVLATLSPLWVNYAQEARMYALETLTSLLASLYLYRMLAALQEEGLSAVKRRWWLWYIFWAALSLWVDYFPVFVLIFHNVFVLAWLWLARPAGRGRFLLRWMGAQALVALLYAPWAFVALSQVTGYGYGTISAPSLPAQIVHLWRAFLVGTGSRDVLRPDSTLSPALETPLLLGMLVLMLGGVVLLASSGAFVRRGRLHLGPWFLLGYILVPFAAFLGILSVRPFYHARYILVATPALYLFLALAALSYGWWRRWLLVPSLGFLVGTFLIGYWFFQIDPNPGFAKGDARPLLAFVGTQLTGQDMVLWETPHPFLYYYDLPAPEAHFPAAWETSPHQLAQVAQGVRRVFWVQWTVGSLDPWRMVPFLLEKYGRQAGQAFFPPHFRVTWFDLALKGEPSLGEFEPVSVSYGDTILLEAAALGGAGEATALPSGEVAWVSLRWQAQERPQQDLKFSIQLRDEQGNVVGQADAFLYNGQHVTARFWRTGDLLYGFATPRVSPGTPPGRYLVELSLYAQNLHAPLEQWREIGPTGLRARPILGTLEVTLPATPAPVADLPIPWTLSSPAAFGPLELVGYEVGGATGGAPPTLALRPGDTVRTGLFWHALQPPSQDRAFTLALVNQEGQTRQEATAVPVEGRFPPSQWREGETVTDWRRLTLPADLMEGDYRLELRGEGHEPVPLARVEVKARPRSFVEPRVDQRLEVQWGGVASLLGFSLAGDLRAKERVTVTLAWRATGTSATPYTVFLHLSDAQERIWAQDDAPPLAGRAPTTSWLAGEMLEDPHQLRLPADLPSGSYAIYVGLYDPLTGQRVRTAAGEDRVVLSNVTVP